MNEICGPRCGRFRASLLAWGKRDECLPLALLRCCPLNHGEEPSISGLRSPHVLAGGMLDRSSGQESHS